MSSTALQLSDNSTMSFWKRPEGKVGKWFNWVLMAGLGYFLFMYRTDLISFIHDMTHLIWSLVGLAITLYVIMDNKLRNLVSFIYKSIMRSITGIFVEMDPVTGIKNKIQRMWEKREEMGRQLVSLKGGLNRLKSLIAENTQNFNNAMSKLQVAKKANDSTAFEFASRSANRYKESNERMQPQLDRLQRVYDMGQMFYNNAEVVIKDKEEDLNLKINEFEIMKSSSKLINAAKGIFQGNDADDMIYNASYDYMMQSIANSEAELDVFADSSKGLMSQINLENGAITAKGEQLLQEFENKTLNFTALGGDKVKVNRTSTFSLPVQGDKTFDGLI